MTASADLRHVVTIRRATQVQNDKGGFDDDWQTIATPRAKIEGLGGRESLLASAMQGVSSYRVTIRWRAGVLQSDQLVLPDGSELNVRSAADPDGRKRWLVIMADDESVIADPDA